MEMRCRLVRKTRIEQDEARLFWSVSSHDLAVRREKPKCDFASKDKKKRTQVFKGSHRKTSLKMYKKKKELRSGAKKQEKKE